MGYVTLYSYAVPLLGGIIAFIVLHEQTSVWQWVAGGVVVGGMLLARWAIMRGARLATPGAEPTELDSGQRAAQEVAD